MDTDWGINSAGNCTLYTSHSHSHRATTHKLTILSQLTFIWSPLYSSFLSAQHTHTVTKYPIITNKHIDHFSYPATDHPWLLCPIYSVVIQHSCTNYTTQDTDVIALTKLLVRLSSAFTCTFTFTRIALSLWQAQASIKSANTINYHALDTSWVKVVPQVNYITLVVTCFCLYFCVTLIILFTFTWTLFFSPVY